MTHRNARFDNLKFILIFLVVLGHFLEPWTGEAAWAKYLFALIYSFHMPLFIFLSGLYAKKNIDEQRYAKIFSLFYLFWVLRLLMFAYYYLMYRRTAFKIFTESGISWYLFALFAFEMITIVTRRFHRGIVLAASVLLACVAGYFDAIGDFLVLSRIIVYYPFFFLGYWIDPDRLSAALDKKAIRFPAAFIVTAYSIAFFAFGEKLYKLRPLFTGRNPFSKLGHFAKLGFFVRLGYYPAVIFICLCIMVIVPKVLVSPAVSKWGGRSLQVYMLHRIPVDLVTNFRKGHPFPLPLFFLIALALTVLLSLKICGTLFKPLLVAPFASARRGNAGSGKSKDV